VPIASQTKKEKEPHILKIKFETLHPPEM
jgi:hypothetical protein